jgi:hypothetical protein
MGIVVTYPIQFPLEIENSIKLLTQTHEKMHVIMLFQIISQICVKNVFKLLVHIQVHFHQKLLSMLRNIYEKV